MQKAPDVGHAVCVLQERERARRELARVRRVPDRDIRPLQTSGSGRVSALVRGQIGRTGDDRLTSVGSAGRDVANFFRQGPSRASAIVWIAVAVLFAGGALAMFVGLRDRMLRKPG